MVITHPKLPGKRASAYVSGFHCNETVMLMQGIFPISETEYVITQYCLKCGNKIGETVYDRNI